MKTEDLIRALAADGTRPITPLSRYLLSGLLCGVVLAVALFLGTLHARSDIAEAFRSPGFDYKVLLALLLLATAGTLLPNVARPLPVLRRERTRLIIPPVLLVLGVAVELRVQPVALWLPRLVGHNALHCLSIIPLLSAAPAACMLLALRHGAPARPAFAGVIAGLMAGGLGAALYALTCPDDSPLFVGSWYSISIAIVTSITGAAASRLLRW